jgi:hypothetical protein
MSKRLPKGKRQEIEQLAATLWLLPTKLRYRFFSAFHDDLHRFFSESEEEREVVGDAAVTVGVSGTMQVRWAGKRAEAELAFGLPPVRFRVCLSKAGRFRVEVDDGEKALETLIAVVKGMRKAERDYLWTLIDETLADYEDYLMAHDPELRRLLDEAYAEIERGNYVTLSSLIK